jgi:hypothetical protein
MSAAREAWEDEVHEETRWDDPDNYWDADEMDMEHDPRDVAARERLESAERRREGR